ncbi:MAG: tetratricopeptide repeat protein [Gaiella sp.]
MSETGAPLTPETLAGLWDFDDPAATERRFHDALVDARAEPGAPLVCEVLTQIARTQGLQRELERASATLDEAEALADPARPRDGIRVLLERGRVANSSQAEGRGRAAFAEAWERAAAAGEDGLAVDAAHMLGIVEQPETAWAWNERAMALARSSADPDARRWVATLANNMGWARHEAGAPEEALELFRLALAERELQDDPRRTQVARWCVARCLRTLGRLEEALALQDALAAELDAAGVVDGYVTEERAECLLELGREHEARSLFARAHAELAADTWLADAEPERVARLARLGGL